MSNLLLQYAPHRGRGQEPQREKLVRGIQHAAAAHELGKGRVPLVPLHRIIACIVLWILDQVRAGKKLDNGRGPAVVL